tara:strand:+ start:393 stop:770 length:378 start_codon:yes stop_codon:yes gene_type:complete
MPTLNKDGSPRKKRVTKQMIIAKNRANGQKKAWAKRKELYPETNGYKPEMVAERKKAKAVEPTSSNNNVEYFFSAELSQAIGQLENFLNGIPGNNFDRHEFISNAIITAVNDALAIQGHKLVTKD